MFTLLGISCAPRDLSFLAQSLGLFVCKVDLRLVKNRPANLCPLSAGTAS